MKTFEELNDLSHDGFIPSEVYYTKQMTPYLKEPGVALVSRTTALLSNTADFLDGFDEDLGFIGYLGDELIEPGARVCKFAGQMCYLSLGDKRTKNKDADVYFDNIVSSGHTSVLEHCVLGFLFYGVSRSFTHEAVRHRVGLSPSQVSQRYVDGTKLRFVERPEWQEDEWLHSQFGQRIDEAKNTYDHIAGYLLKKQSSGDELLSAERKTDLRKKVNQAARSVLPNETEAPIVFTGNVRAWHHFLDLRASEHAEIEIRAVAFRVYLIASKVEPLLFQDYEPYQLSDGTWAVRKKGKGTK